MKMMIVEDGPVSLIPAHLVLAAEGHEALPVIDGLTLARNLKRNRQTRHIIIAITAFPEPYPRELAIAAGCDAYIVKPIDTRRLSQQVAEAVENGS